MTDEFPETGPPAARGPRWMRAPLAVGRTVLATLSIPGSPAALRDDLVAAIWPDRRRVRDQEHWYASLRAAGMTPYGVRDWIGDVSVSGVGHGHDGGSVLHLTFSREAGSFADAVAGNPGGARLDIETVVGEQGATDATVERPPSREVRQAAGQLAAMVDDRNRLGAASGLDPVEAILTDRNENARAYARLPWDTIDLPVDGEPVTFWLLRPPPEEVDDDGREVWVAYGVAGGSGLRLAAWGLSPRDVALVAITDLDPIIERDRERRADPLG
jgi:hypothetical protein